MLPFFRRLTRGLHDSGMPSSADGALQRLRAALVVLPPQEAMRKLSATLPELLAPEEAPLLRLRRLEAIAAIADGLLPTLEDALESASLPLSRAQLADALAGDNLLKALAGEFQRVALAIATHGKSAHPDLLGQATLGAVRQLLRRQLLAVRAGKTASSASWRRLHRLYRLARDRRIHEFAAPAAGAVSIETAYLNAVLLVLADPAAVPRAELPAMLKALQRLAPLGRLHDLGPDVTATRRLLQVSPQDDRPSLVDAEEGKRNAAWQLDLEPIIHCLQAELRSNETASGTAPVTDAIPRKVLVRLLECWRRQPVRRFSRQSMRPRVDVVTGFDHLWWALSHPVPARRAIDGAGQRPETAAEWVIVNESAEGFGLSQITGKRPDIDVGDIIGVGLRDVSRLHLCIVRRIDEDRRGRCQLGVQHLSPEAEAIVVVDRSNGRQQAAIRFASLPARDHCGGIATPAGQLSAGDRRQVIGDGTLLRIGDLAEDNGRVALHLIGQTERV